MRVLVLPEAFELFHRELFLDSILIAVDSCLPVDVSPTAADRGHAAIDLDPGGMRGRGFGFHVVGVGGIHRNKALALASHHLQNGFGRCLIRICEGTLEEGLEDRVLVVLVGEAHEDRGNAAFFQTLLEDL